MAAGLLKSQSSLESWHMGITGMKQFQRQKHWPCEYWLTGLNMGKRFQNLRKYSQYQDEPMAFNQSPSSPRCFASYWLDNQTAVRHLSPRSYSGRLACLRFCIS